MNLVCRGLDKIDKHKKDLNAYVADSLSKALGISEIDLDRFSILRVKGRQPSVHIQFVSNKERNRVWQARNNFKGSFFPCE